jgi:hypothetical protein
MKACDLSNPPQWYSELNDELQALSIKYIKIAQAENTHPLQVTHSFISVFAAQIIAFTPRGEEQGILKIFTAFFNDMHPGWNIQK